VGGENLVGRLTNAVTSMDICLVHLHRQIGSDGIEKQKSLCRALLRWAMRHLSANLLAPPRSFGLVSQLDTSPQNEESPVQAVRAASAAPA
jgi:hypothetical protein